MKRFALMIATLMVATTPIAAPLMAKTAAHADYSVGPQYDTTHVYVPEGTFDAFVASFVTTFGGKTSKQGEFQVTPTPSLTKSQLALTPAGTVSVFGFKTRSPTRSETNAPAIWSATWMPPWMPRSNMARFAASPASPIP
jgi:hypothetical protein